MGTKNIEKVYEIAFHLVPTLSESMAESAFKDVKSKINSSGKVIEEEVPSKIELSYPIKHHTRQDDGTFARFIEAYFASVKFKGSSDQVDNLKKTIQQDESILRSLVIESTPESTRTTIEFGKTENESKPEDSNVPEIVETVEEDNN